MDAELSSTTYRWAIQKGQQEREGALSLGKINLPQFYSIRPPMSVSLSCFCSCSVSPCISVQFFSSLSCVSFALRLTLPLVSALSLVSVTLSSSSLRLTLPFVSDFSLHSFFFSLASAPCLTLPLVSVTLSLLFRLAISLSHLTPPLFLFFFFFSFSVFLWFCLASSLSSLLSAFLFLASLCFPLLSSSLPLFFHLILTSFLLSLPVDFFFYTSPFICFSFCFSPFPPVFSSSLFLFFFFLRFSGSSLYSVSVLLPRSFFSHLTPLSMIPRVAEVRGQESSSVTVLFSFSDSLCSASLLPMFCVSSFTVLMRFLVCCFL